jgi:hypothetical protein
MAATTRSRPWHFGHSRTSTEKDRRSKDAQSTRGEVAYPAEQAIPVLHREDVRRELMTSPGRTDDRGRRLQRRGRNDPGRRLVARSPLFRLCLPGWFSCGLGCGGPA